MKRDFFPGATYADARLDGQIAVLFPNITPGPKGGKPPFIQLRDRQIMLPNQLKVGDLGDLPLYHRVTADGAFKIGAQVADRDPSAPGKGTWEWTAERGWYRVDPYSYGVNATIYRGQELYISNPGWGSQGFRYIATDTGAVIKGDETLNDQSPLAQSLGVHALCEWTHQGDITIGQDPVSDCIAACMGRRYTIEPGTVYFIRFVSDGENCVVSIVTPAGAVIRWFTRTELLNDFFPEQSGKQPGPIVDEQIRIPIIPFEVKPGITSGPKAPDVPSPSSPLIFFSSFDHPVESPRAILTARTTNMIHIDTTTPVIRALSGERHDNGNGTFSVKQKNGKYFCVTPEGHIEERDSPGGPWESFTASDTVLIAERDWNGGIATYLLPFAETK